MFSGFRFRNRNADPAQALGGKRPNENDNSHHDEIEEPTEKMGRSELDSLCLPLDLKNFVPKHVRKDLDERPLLFIYYLLLFSHLF